MEITRRSFLTRTSAVTWGMGLPVVFQRAASAAPKSDRPGGDQTVLVVVQLSGGNDGLNTVIPYRDPAYRQARPKLRQDAAKVKTINADLALHPAMQGFADLLEKSRLAIVQGVGYPNPNRSHFSSMDIWHKATRSTSQRYGWLGRTLPRLGNGSAAMYIGEGESPLALFGTTGYAPSLTSLADYQMKIGGGRDSEAKRRLITDFAAGKPSHDSRILNLVRETARATYASSEQLRKVARSYKTPVAYPSTGLAARLRLVAQLIDAGVPERIYYTALGGFDTHAAQSGTHSNLLKELSDAVAAFQKDITHHGHHKRVLVMTFSEFGRRVRENGSGGTDHGTASQMFLIGEKVRSGLIGKHPRMTDLDQGDLKFHTDFRSVYATILKQWLKIDPLPILGKPYPQLKLVRHVG